MHPLDGGQLAPNGQRRQPAILRALDLDGRQSRELAVVYRYGRAALALDAPSKPTPPSRSALDENPLLSEYVDNASDMMVRIADGRDRGPVPDAVGGVRSWSGSETHATAQVNPLPKG